MGITKLRFSAHKFPVETGKYTNTEHDLGICTSDDRG